MVDKPPFEIPSELRDLTEKNIEQARAAYGQFMDFLTQTMNAWSGAPSNAMTAGFRAVQDRAIGFAKENAEGSFALASELANAKDMQEVLTLQSRYAQTQIQTYARQVQELGQLMSKAIRDMQPKG
jgi:phasin